MKLDILVIAAHPDDAELGCGATIAKHVALGHKVGVVDLTQGELGTRGSADIRAKEAADAAAILGLSVRENLNLKDGFFRNDPESQIKLISQIRNYQPDIVLANALYDRHPDHGRGASLAFEASFYSGLVKIETKWDGTAQAPWRPKAIYHYVQSQPIEPHLLVDVSSFWETKMKAVRAYKSQFFNPESTEPETYISQPAFMQMLEARAIELGHSIGVKYAEAFNTKRVIGVDNLVSLI